MDSNHRNIKSRGGSPIYKSYKRKKDAQQQSDEASAQGAAKQPIPPDIDECEKLVKSSFCNSFDIMVQKLSTSHEQALIVFVEGIVNKNLIDRDIIKPLKAPDYDGDVPRAIKTLYEETEDFSTLVSKILMGNVCIIYGKSRKAI